MIERMLPETFSEAWRKAVGPLPEEFVETYELLCEALYWGVRSYESDGRPPGKGGYKVGYWFGDASLLEVKGRADTYLSQTASALHRWTEASRRRRTKGSAEARGVALSGAWRKGHRAQDRKE